MLDELAADPARAKDLKPQEIPPLLARIAGLGLVLSSRLIKTSDAAGSETAEADRLFDARELARYRVASVFATKSDSRDPGSPGSRDGSGRYDQSAASIKSLPAANVGAR
jgi:hypothetical protein